MASDSATRVVQPGVDSVLQIVDGDVRETVRACCSPVSGVSSGSRSSIGGSDLGGGVTLRDPEEMLRGILTCGVSAQDASRILVSYYEAARCSAPAVSTTSSVRTESVRAARLEKWRSEVSVMPDRPGQCYLRVIRWARRKAYSEKLRDRPPLRDFVAALEPGDIDVAVARKVFLYRVAGQYGESIEYHVAESCDYGVCLGSVYDCVASVIQEYPSVNTVYECKDYTFVQMPLCGKVGVLTPPASRRVDVPVPASSSVWERGIAVSTSQSAHVMDDGDIVNVDETRRGFFGDRGSPVDSVEAKDARLWFAQSVLSCLVEGTADDVTVVHCVSGAESAMVASYDVDMPCAEKILWTDECVKFKAESWGAVVLPHGVRVSCAGDEYGGAGQRLVLVFDRMVVIHVNVPKSVSSIGIVTVAAEHSQLLRELLSYHLCDLDVESTVWSQSVTTDDALVNLPFYAAQREIASDFGELSWGSNRDLYPAVGLCRVVTSRLGRCCCCHLCSVGVDSRIVCDLTFDERYACFEALRLMNTDIDPGVLDSAMSYAEVRRRCGISAVARAFPVESGYSYLLAIENTGRFIIAAILGPRPLVLSFMRALLWFGRRQSNACLRQGVDDSSSLSLHQLGVERADASTVLYRELSAVVVADSTVRMS